MFSQGMGRWDAQIARAEAVAMIELRPYQRAAVDAIYTAFGKGMQAPLIVMPTASGKSPTLCAFLKEALERYPDQRMLMLVHNREIIAQNHQTMLRIWPEAPVTIYSAGLRSRDMSGQIVFGSIQSLYDKGFKLQHIDLVIIDEAHLIPPSGEGMYRKLLADLALCNGGPVPLVGFTATPFRMSSGSLIEGDGRVFDKIAYEAEMIPLIKAGWLCPPVTRAGKTQIDTSGVGTRGGEYVQRDLQRAADREQITRAACQEIIKAGVDRRAWICFATGIEHALHIRDELRAQGISCERVTGETPLAERDRIIQAFQRGELRCLTNDSVLTTGFDAPMVDLIALLRPTKSPGLYVQMVGRGSRLADGKNDFLVLDFGGNAARHGPIDLITGRVKNGTGPAPMKECPECRAVLLAGLAVCPDCGHQFELERERALHEGKSSDLPILSEGVSDWLPVDRVTYHYHTKPGARPTLRADYHTGLMKYSSWLCFEHGGFPAAKAARWWMQRAVEPVPMYVLEALKRCASIETPKAIKIQRDGKYWRIAAERFQ